MESIQKTDFEDRLQQGLDAFAEQKYPQAIDILKKLALDYPKNPDVWAVLGVVYEETGELDLSIKANYEAIKLTPDNFMFWQNLGNTYFSAKEYFACVQAYEKAVQTDQAHPTAYLNLAAAYAYLNDDSNAKRILIEALQKRVDFILAIQTDPVYEVLRPYLDSLHW